MPAVDPLTLKSGDRVRLIEMPNDPDPVQAGSEGVVDFVTDIGFRGKREIQVCIRWDSGRGLNCICPPDVLELVSTDNETGSCD